MSLRPLAWMAAICVAFLGGRARADVIFIDDLYFRGMQPENRRPPEFLCAIACAPDGKTLVSAGKTGFEFWSLHSGKRLDRLPGENIYGSGVAFSPDGQALYTADLAGNLLRWDVEKRRVTFRFPKVHASIERMTLSSDGSTLATTDGTCTVCWDARTGRFRDGWNNVTTPVNHYRRRYNSWSYDGGARDKERMPNRNHLVLSADGQWCASHVDNSAMQVRATAKAGPVKNKWADDAIAGLDFSPDGKRFAVASRNGDVQIVDSVSLHPRRAFKGAGPDCLVRFAPDGATLITHHPEIGILAAFDAQTGRKLWHHRQDPAWRSTALAFSCDGKQIITGDSDRSMRVYELASGKLLCTLAFPPAPKTKEAAKIPPPPLETPLPEHARFRLGTPHLWYPSPLTAGFFLNDGKELLVFPQWDGVTAPLVYDTQTGRLVRRLDALQEAQLGYQQVLLAPDRRQLLLANGNSLTWWDLDKNRVVRTYQFPSAISAVAVSQDGKRFAVAGSAEWLCPQPIHVWDMDGEHVQSMQGHDAAISKLAFTPDGKRLFSANVQQQRQEIVPGLIVEWDVATGKTLRTLRHDASQVAPSPDCIIWAIHRPNAVLQLFNWERQESFVNLITRVGTFAFSPDGKTIAADDAPFVAGLWEASTGKRLRIFDGHPEQGTAILCFSSDGKMLATHENHDRNDGGSIRLWDVDTGKELCPNPHQRGPVHSVAYSPDGRTIVSAGDDRRVLWWNAKTGALEHASDGNDASIKLVRFSTDGRRLLSLSHRQIAIWDAATRKMVRAIGLEREDTPFPLAITFGGDGKEFLTVYADGFVKTWEAATGKLKGKFSVNGKPDPEEAPPPLIMAVFSADGAQLAFHRRLGNEILLWNIAAQRHTRAFAFAPPPDPDLGGMRHSCSALAFSPDGRYVTASVSEMQYRNWRFDYPPPLAVTFVWEIAGGAKALTAHNLSSTIATLVFSPDGRTLLHNMPTAGSPERIAYYSGDLGGVYEAGNPRAGGVLRDLTTGADLALFTGTGPTRICTTTGWELPALPGALYSATSAAFSPDGRSVATIDANRTLLVWDVAKMLPRPATPVKRLEPAELDQAWATFSGSDSAKAHAAIWRLTRDPHGTLAFLKERLAPPPVPQEQRLQQLIRILDTDQFTARAQAMRELDRYAELAEPALRQALARETDLERKRRLEGLLARLAEDLRPDWLQQSRAVEAVEKIDDAGAGALLAELSRGPAGARLTHEARAALARWQRRR